jgi:hypothetical protein
LKAQRDPVIRQTIELPLAPGLLRPTSRVRLASIVSPNFVFKGPRTNLPAPHRQR